MNGGLEQLETIYIATHIVIPVIIWSLDFLLIPYFISKCLCCFVSSYTYQSLLVRYSYSIYSMIRIGLFFGQKLYKNMIRLHDEMRDSRYLVGTELTNRNNNADIIPLPK